MVIYTVSPRGGAHASLCTLVRCLDPAIEVSVVSTRPEIAAELAGLRAGTDSCVVAPVRNKADLPGILRHARAVRALRPDVLHVSSDNPWSAPYGLLAGLISRCPTVAVVHGPAPAWRRRQRWLVRRVARHLDALVSVSDASARAVELSLGLARGRVRTIYNAVDLGARYGAEGSARARPPADRDRSSARLGGCPPRRAWTCSCGRWPGCRALARWWPATARSGRPSSGWLTSWGSRRWSLSPDGWRLLGPITSSQMCWWSRRAERASGWWRPRPSWPGSRWWRRPLAAFRRCSRKVQPGCWCHRRIPRPWRGRSSQSFRTAESTRTRVARGLESARRRFEPTVMAAAYEALYAELAGRRAQRAREWPGR